MYLVISSLHVESLSEVFKAALGLVAEDDPDSASRALFFSYKF